MTKFFQHSLYGRLAYLFAAIICFASVAFAILYLQDVKWLEPCPYCKLQRVIFIFVGIIFLICAIFHPKRIWAFFSSILLLLGVTAGWYVSAKHIYIQQFPSENSASCSAMNDDLIEVLDFQFIKGILSAKGDCSKIEWSFYGLSLPMLSFIGFSVMAIWGLYILWQNMKKPSYYNYDRYY